MTYCTNELIARRVPSDRIAFRAWRRAHRLTHADVAMLTGMCADTIMRFELGHTRRKHSSRCPERLKAFMRDWDGRRPVRPVNRRGRKRSDKQLDFLGSS